MQFIRRFTCSRNRGADKLDPFRSYLSASRWKFNWAYYFATKILKCGCWDFWKYIFVLSNFLIDFALKHLFNDFYYFKINFKVTLGKFNAIFGTDPASSEFDYNDPNNRLDAVCIAAGCDSLVIAVRGLFCARI